MPNYCENKLFIKGSSDIIKDLVSKHFDEGHFSFDTIVPEPKTFDECPLKFVIPEGDRKVRLDSFPGKEWFNWYDWRCEFWGTKWDASDTSYSICATSLIDSELNIFFTTAWSPCINIIRKLIELYPELDIDYQYFEPGMFFAGRIYTDNNVVMFDKCRDEEVKQFSIDYGFVPVDAYDEEEEE